MGTEQKTTKNGGKFIKRNGVIVIPRIARQYKNASFFHIIVQGIRKEDIFRKERYINEYLKLIKKYAKDLNIKIIAYCIMNNHAHLLLETKQIEYISKMMQKVNSLYARYYNYMENGRVGYVFRDRFISEAIKNKTYLINCVKYIHNNPVKAGICNKSSDYKHSSFNIYTRISKRKRDGKIFTKEEYIEICKNTQTKQSFIEVCDKNIEEIISQGIKAYLKKEQIELCNIFIERVKLKGLIKYLKNVEKVQYVKIRETLDLNKGIMESILRDIRKENRK